MQALFVPTGEVKVIQDNNFRISTLNYTLIRTILVSLTQTPYFQQLSHPKTYSSMGSQEYLAIMAVVLMVFIKV